MHPTELDALFAFLAAAALTALLTPLTMRLARALRAVDQPRERGLSDRPVPLLGGLAIFAGVLVAGLIWLPARESDGPHWYGVLLAAGVITLVGALDDRFDLHPALKLAGQILAALIAVHYGVVVKDISVPFVGLLQFPHEGPAITVVGLVALMNVVNFSDAA
jgi:UDP-GlcNAc:undecaprenyl-phosphate GlcNAc-1-phosphate transferase